MVVPRMPGSARCRLAAFRTIPATCDTAEARRATPRRSTAGQACTMVGTASSRAPSNEHRWADRGGGIRPRPVWALVVFGTARGCSGRQRGSRGLTTSSASNSAPENSEPAVSYMSSILNSFARDSPRERSGSQMATTCTWGSSFCQASRCCRLIIPAPAGATRNGKAMSMSIVPKGEEPRLPWQHGKYSD